MWCGNLAVPPEKASGVPSIEQAKAMHVKMVEANRLAAEKKFHEARQLCQDALALYPDHPDAHQILGLICQQEGQSAKAISHFQQSLTTFPEQPHLWLRIGYLARLQGELPLARSSFLETLQHDSHNSFAMRYLAELASPDEVSTRLRQLETALTEPSLTHAEHKLQIFEGLCALFTMQNLTFMANSYRALAAMLSDRIAGRSTSPIPDYSPEQRERIKHQVLQAERYIAQDNVSRAEKILKKLLEELPRQADALHALGLAAVAKGKHREAVDFFRQSLEIAPTQQGAWKNLGTALMADRQSALSQHAFHVALALNPQDVEVLCNLALYRTGEKEWTQAQQLLERALQLSPRFVPVYELLLQIQDFKPSQGFVEALTEIASNPQTKPNQAVSAFFALAKHYERNGPAEQFVVTVREANRRQEATHSKTISPLPAALNLSKQFFSSKTFHETVPESSKKITPIFVVGAPRSGTTLVEQMLGNHPLIFPGDELPTLIRDLVNPMIEKTGLDYPLGLESLSLSELCACSEHYQTSLQTYTTQHPFITDKKFDNLFYLGFVRKVLPWAKVIWLQRNMMDVAFSIFTNHFTNDVWYSFNQKDLAIFMQMCLEARSLWKTTAPEFVLDVQYEQLVTAPEEEVRRILNFVGVAFDAACLKFYESKRPALTLSISQVQKPIYTSSIGRWKKYPALLSEFREAMGSLMDDNGFSISQREVVEKST